MSALIVVYGIDLWLIALKHLGNGLCGAQVIATSTGLTINGCHLLKVKAYLLLLKTPMVKYFKGEDL